MWSFPKITDDDPEDCADDDDDDANDDEHDDVDIPRVLRTFKIAYTMATHHSFQATVIS